MRPALALASAITLGVVVTPAHAQKGDSRRITADEIAAAKDVKTAWEAVGRIRPAFLRPATSVVPFGAAEDRVYNKTGRQERSLFVDEVLRDRLEDLREIRAVDVQLIELVSAVDAIIRYGQGHPHGALAVTLKRVTR